MCHCSFQYQFLKKNWIFFQVMRNNLFFFLPMNETTWWLAPVESARVCQSGVFRGLDWLMANPCSKGGKLISAQERNNITERALFPGAAENPESAIAEIPLSQQFLDGKSTKSSPKDKRRKSPPSVREVILQLVTRQEGREHCVPCGLGFRKTPFYDINRSRSLFVTLSIISFCG